MHPKRREAIKQKIVKLVSEITLDKELLTRDFIDLQKELYTLTSKEKKLSFLSYSDLSNLILQQILKQTFGKNFFNEDEKNLIRKEIVMSTFNLLILLPKKYKIFLNIPIFSSDIKYRFGNLEIPFSLSRERKIKTRVLEEYRKEYISFDPGSGINFEIEGYLGNNENVTFNKALSYIKLFIQRGLANQIYLIRNEEYPYFKDDIP